MKLLRCDFDDGIRAAVKNNGQIIDVVKADSFDAGSFIQSLRHLTRDGTDYLKDVANKAPESAYNSESEVDILSPIGSEGRLFALGGVYTRHLRERDASLNKVPSQWLVPKTAIVGPNEPIILLERIKESVMPAVELCIVIGQRGKYIEERNAMEYVAGYSIANDLTARADWPGAMAYKLIDTFSPCGPGVTPRDQIRNINSLKMTLHQDGECICEGSTASMRFSIPFLISYLSSIIELRPGDIISTGDPGRVKRELIVGEPIRASIEGVGSIQNPVTTAKE